MHGSRGLLSLPLVSVILAGIVGAAGVACRRAAPEPTIAPLHPAETASAEPSAAAMVAPSGSCSGGCVEEAPPPILAPGPVFLAVNKVGVVRLDEEGARTVFAVPGVNAMAAGPRGELWVSAWEKGLVRIDQGKTEKMAKEVFQKLILRPSQEVWGVTEDTEWSVMHYDGRRWEKPQGRAKFPGFYEDNKFVDLAVSEEGSWLACWNGLWLRAGAGWQLVEPPKGMRSPHAWPQQLRVSQQHLIARYEDGYFVRENGAWRQLSWPPSRAIWSINEAGFAAGGRMDFDRILMGPAEAAGGWSTSEAVPSSLIEDVAVDQAGRSWVATDYAFLVLGRTGRILGTWTPGTLAGVSGKVSRLAITGGGLARLPGAQAARTWEVSGRAEVYKSGAPLAHVSVSVCPGLLRKADCAGAPLAKFGTTGADGSFRIAGIPEGDFVLHVNVPPNTPGCEGIFSRVAADELLNPARDCHPSPEAPTLCPLPPVRVCLPFEMPPPIPRK